MSIPTITCGVSQMPVVGFGTSRTKDPRGEVEMALSAGYRHVDCAYCYENEPEIGQAFSKMITNGSIKREDMFITSKLWGTFHRGHLVETACNKTLSNLQLDYLDLYLIHWPMPLEPEDKGGYDPESKIDSNPPPFSETWVAMEKLVKSGKCRNIGLSNFNIDQLQEVLDCAKIKPANLQVESHPLFPNTQLLDFCNEHGISFVSFGPLGSPGRIWKKEDQISLLDDEDVLKITQKHNVTAGKVLLRYQIDKGNAVIPKTGTLLRMKENLDIFSFSLDHSDMDCLNNLYKKAGPDGYRIFNYINYKHSPYYPFASELLS